MVLLIVTVLSACQTKYTESELKTYIKNPENGLIQHKQINNVNYQITYKPASLLLKQELKNIKPLPELVDSLKNKYSKYYYFTLHAQVNNQEILSDKMNDKAEFAQAIYQLSFNMNEKVFLVNQSKDTLALVDYVYPRMYGMIPQTTMLFVFDKKEHDNSEQLTLYLNEFGLNTGNTSFKFLIENLNKIPELAY